MFGKTCPYIEDFEHGYYVPQSLDSLLDLYIQERKKITEFGEIKEYKSNFFTSQQKSYTQKKDAVNALKDALEGLDVDLISHLPTLRDGRLGEYLRWFVKNGPGTDLVSSSKEVTTVRQFIHALQEKVDALNANPLIKKAKH